MIFEIRELGGWCKSSQMHFEVRHMSHSVKALRDQALSDLR